MGRSVEGADRSQSSFLPACLDDWVDENNPVHVIEAFVDALDLSDLGFGSSMPASTGRPAYYPAVLLKLYIYGYLNRVQSSRCLEREVGRSVELMWLLARLVPDHKTIGDFRRKNGPAIRRVCVRFVSLCRQMGLLAGNAVVIDGSKFKAVNNRDRNFTHAKMARRLAQIEESIARYLHQLDSADRQQPSDAIPTKTARLKEKIGRLRQEMRGCRPHCNAAKPQTSGAKAEGRFGKQDFVYLPDQDAYRCPAGTVLTYHFSNVEKGMELRRYWSTAACLACAIKQQCTTSKERRITHWKHEDLIEDVQNRLDANPELMRVRRETVEHPFGTIKARMGATHFLMKRRPHVAAEMALHILAYNLTRVMNILGRQALVAAIRAA